MVVGNKLGNKIGVLLIDLLNFKEQSIYYCLSQFYKSTKKRENNIITTIHQKVDVLTNIKYVINYIN